MSTKYTDKQIEDAEPLYCPRCGIAELNAVMLGSDDEGYSWDCACSCGWTGDISPDEVNL